jgi:hypothetical protein
MNFQRVTVDDAGLSGKIIGERSCREDQRQALRDISKAGGAVAMVKAWPLRPDGTDAISHLRARI